MKYIEIYRKYNFSASCAKFNWNKATVQTILSKVNCWPSNTNETTLLQQIRYNFAILRNVNFRNYEYDVSRERTIVHIYPIRCKFICEKEKGAIMFR